MLTLVHTAWATLHAVVAIFSEYSRHFSLRKRRVYRRLWSPKTVAVFSDIITVLVDYSHRFWQLKRHGDYILPKRLPFSAILVSVRGDYSHQKRPQQSPVWTRFMEVYNYGRFDSRFDSNSNRNARFDSVFDSNANGRFAGP